MEAQVIQDTTIELGNVKKEKEPGESTVLLYGQHRVKEVVAYEVARRISKFSLLRKNGGLISVEYPEGFDYNDAYEEAKQETEKRSPKYDGIRDLYHRKIKVKSLEANEIRDRTCDMNKDKLITDIHETTDFSRESLDLRRDEIIFLTSLTYEENSELNRRLADIFPDAEDVSGYQSKLRLFAKNPTKENTESKLPGNYMAVELITRGDDIYDKVANKEGMFVIGTDEREDYLHRKKTDGNPDMAINREATKYTRLLEKVIPEIEKYYTEKILPTV